MKVQEEERSVGIRPSISHAPETKQARSAVSTRKLLDAAAELIAEVGLTNTTLVRIGERAGYSRGLVTRRFGSREGLLLALVERMSIGWFETYMEPQVDASSGFEGLRMRATAIREGWEMSNRRMRALDSLMFQAVIQSLPSVTEQMRELNRIALRSTQAITTRGVADGSIRADVNPSTVARQLTAQFRGLSVLTMLLPDEFDIFEAVTDIETYVNSLAT